MSKNRTNGRNMRKRSVRRMQQSQHLETYSASGDPKKKLNPVTELPTCGNLLAQLRQRFLDAHAYELRKCASLLGLPGCWDYYYQHLSHARKMRYEDEFRVLVYSAARRFLGRSVRTGLEAK